MRWSLLAVVPSLAACVASVPASSRSVPSSSPAVTVATNAIGDEVVVRTNAQRRALGLFELRHNGLLMQAAQLQADQMAAKQHMAHDLPGTRYPGLDDRLTAVRYTWRASGENVAEGYSDANSVVNGWMKSPGHRENIVSTRFTEMGAGMAT